MRIVKRVLSTYSADNFGFCSALYELGGLVVMHDASGCNSTYNTHDEPRWYDTDSMVFISGLTEKDAIFGNDDRLIDDLVKAAEEMHPRFVAVCGGPLPHRDGFPGSGEGRLAEDRNPLLRTADERDGQLCERGRRCACGNRGACKTARTEAHKPSRKDKDQSAGCDPSRLLRKWECPGDGKVS